MARPYQHLLGDSHLTQPLHPSLFSIYLIKLRHAPFNHSSSSFTPPVLPLYISISWSWGRMKVRHTPTTVKVLSLSPLNSSFSWALAGWIGVGLAFFLDWWIMDWLAKWLPCLPAGYTCIAGLHINAFVGRMFLPLSSSLSLFLTLSPLLPPALPIPKLNSSCTRGRSVRKCHNCAPLCF